MKPDSTEALKLKLNDYKDGADPEVFSQAVLLAAGNKIRWKEVEDWAGKTGCTTEFKLLKLAYCKVAKKALDGVD